jgi:predicted dehydrogenase
MLPAGARALQAGGVNQKGPGLRILLVGAGHWHAARHLESLRVLGHLIVGVTDASRDHAERVGRECGCPSGVDPVDMVGRVRPDLVVAMAVHRDVPTMVDRLLDTGRPLVLEKPLGRNANEARPLVEKAERQGCYAAVCFPIRYAPIWRRVAELTAAGEFGEISYASFRLINGSPERYRRDRVTWMLDPEQAGGGSLLNLGIHACDAFLRIADGPVSVLAAQCSNKIHRLPIEDYSVATLRSTSGVLGLVESGYSYPALSGGDMEWRLVSERAYLQLGRETCVVRTMPDREEVSKPPSFLELYEMAMADAVARLRQGQPPPATLRECLEAMELVDAIYATAGVVPFSTGKTEG